MRRLRFCPLLCTIENIFTLSSLNVFDPSVKPSWGGAGRDGARRPLSRHLHCHSQQVHLFPGGIQHVVLPNQTSAITIKHQSCFQQHNALERSVNTPTHIDTGVIGQYAIIGQCHILLLPLFVERVPTALQQDALTEATTQKTVNLLLMSQVFISHITAA